MAKTYKRGQVELALWRFFSGKQVRESEPHRIFKTRIKRLLELDRIEQEEGERFAFAETLPMGQGIDVAFTPFDAFCLALALDLLEIGFKQSEIVYLISQIRAQLKIEYDWIMQRPFPVRSLISAEDAPDRPSYQDKKLKMKIVDLRVFAVIQKVEVTDGYRTLGRQGNPHAPIFLEPKFCRGIEALRDELHHMGLQYRKAMVLEIAHAASMVEKYLKEAPLRKRGRG